MPGLPALPGFLGLDTDAGAHIVSVISEVHRSDKSVDIVTIR
jgi:hypothetical protein